MSSNEAKAVWKGLIPSLFFFLSSACGTIKPKPDSSSLRIIGGVADPQIFPTTVKLSIAKVGLVDTCTGTFISDDLLLTAGHCLSGAKAIFVSSEYSPFPTPLTQAIDFVIHPEFKANIIASKDINGNAVEAMTIPLESMYADIGIARFPKGTAPQKFIAKLAALPPLVGQEVYVAGYGVNKLSGEGAGIKRFGKNKLAAIYPNASDILGIVGLHTPPGILDNYDQAITSNGDSGAALYNVDSEIMGTVSSGVLPPEFPDSQISTFTNVWSAKTRSFLQDFIDEIAK